MDEVRARAAHVTTQMTDIFEAEIWKRCLPGALTNHDCIARIRADSGLFLTNVTAFTEFLLLRWIGEFRAAKAGKPVPEALALAEVVLSDLEALRVHPVVVGQLREWAMFCLAYRLAEMLGKSTLPVMEVVSPPAAPEPTPEAPKRMRLAKGWKVRSKE